MDKKIEYFTRKLNSFSVPEENKKAILDFFDYNTARGVSKARVLVHANRLLPLVQMYGDMKFKDATKMDTQRIMAQIERNDHYAPMTKDMFRVTLKRFYKWLLGNDEAYPECVRWIKTTASAKRIMP